MEIIVHIIKDLNRFLNLGLYILLDSDKICLMSLKLGCSIKDFSATTSLELYSYLTQLKNLITSWHLNSSLGKTAAANANRRHICVHYNFDITKHYYLSKYE